jgi:hypothetical protein
MMAEKISEEQKQGKDDPSSKEETRFADKGRSMKDVLMEDYDGQMYKEIVGLFTEKRTWLDSDRPLSANLVSSLELGSSFPCFCSSEIFSAIIAPC